jgi:glycosyltransferase involved in cell wall biosynthesis
MQILLIIPDLAYGGAARQLTLLAAGLPRERFAPHVCILGGAGPWAKDLQAAGVAISVHGARHPLDPRAVRGLWQRLRACRPDVVHAWRLPAVRLAAALCGRRRLIASWCLDGCRGPGWLDRRLLPLCSRVTAAGATEAGRCRQFGLPADRVAVVPPGVVCNAAAPGVARRALGLPASARLIVGVGPLEPGKGFHDAVWAFNILQGLYDELHLVLIGAGPEEERLRRFARSIQTGGRAHFVGPQAFVAGYLADAEVVWAPDRAGASRNVVLEALAAGRPVVAAPVADVAELLGDDTAGLRVPPGDRAGLARLTRRLLDDAGLRRRLGEAGRQRAEQEYDAAIMVRRFAELYEAVAGGRTP